MKKIALNILFFLSFLISFSQIATYPLNEDLNDTTNSFHGSYNPFSCCDFAKMKMVVFIIQVAWKLAKQFLKKEVLIYAI